MVKYNYVLSVIPIFLFWGTFDASHIQIFCLSEAAITLSFKYGQLYKFFQYKQNFKLNRNISIPTSAVRVATVLQKEKNTYLHVVK